MAVFHVLLLAVLGSKRLRPTSPAPITLAFKFVGSCVVELLLNNQTVAAMGSSAACIWSDGSTEAVVSFDDEFDDAWEPNTTILLPGG